MKLKGLVFLAGFCLTSSAVPLTAGAAMSYPVAEVPAVEDFTSLGQQSHQQRLPILLVFSAEDCDYCHLLEEEFLKPLMINAAYDDRVIIRRVMIDSPVDFTDFNGKRISVDTFRRNHKVKVTPTVVFVGHDGQPLGPRLIGINTVDFYGYYLENAIQESLLKVRAN